MPTLAFLAKDELAAVHGVLVLAAAAVLAPLACSRRGQGIEYRRKFRIRNARIIRGPKLENGRVGK
jgi:hypothetical protein